MHFRTCMAMQTKALMLITFSKNSFFFLKRSILGGISLTDKHFRPSITTIVNYFNYFFHPRVVTTTKLTMPIRSSL